MALSNWDTMAVDEKGNPTTGIFKTKLGVVARIYKNWIYVEDVKIWEDGDYSYTKPIIMQVGFGSISYKDLHILAIEGPQNGCYVIVRSKDKGMIGVGCMGYYGRHCRFNGLSKKALEFIEVFRKKEWGNHPGFKKAMRFNQGDAFFVGIKKAMTKPGKAKETIFSQIMKVKE